MIYKNRPGGYITMPVAITKCNRIGITEKFVLCFIMGFWLNKGDTSFSIRYISSSLGLDVDSVKGALNRILSLGLMKISDKRNNSSGDVSFTAAFDVNAVNSFFGCELIGVSEVVGKTEPVKQPVRKQVMMMEKPLAWMESEYYKNREQGCRR